MAKNCIICGKPTIFYRWTTDRYFDTDRLEDVIKPSKTELIILRKFGDVVCEVCSNKYNLMKARK